MMDPELEKLRHVLIDIARKGAFTTYQPVADLFGLEMANPAHRREIGRLLGEVSRFEVSQGRPMLSSVVVLSGDDVPGHGVLHARRGAPARRAWRR